MVIILAVLAVPVILTIGFLRGDASDPERRIPRPYRMSTSLILALLATYLWLGPLRATPLAAAAVWFALGMIFGFLGDLIMAHLIPTPNRLIFGILAFGVGHSAYIIGFIQTATALGLAHPLTERWPWLVYIAAAAVLWWLAVRSPAAPTALNTAALLYAGLIAVMAGAAAGLAVQDIRFLIPALGGILFLASDLIIGAHEFRHLRWPLIHDIIWITYITGQALIVITPLLAVG